MENIKNLLKNKKPKKSKITNERQEVVSWFVEKLNAERKGKYKPISKRYCAIRMSVMNIDELKAFYGTCKDAKNFSKYWWWATNPSKHK